MSQKDRNPELGLFIILTSLFIAALITCNLIAPGFISTPMTDKLTVEQQNKIIVNIPANRLGKPEDISNGCIYLASDEASFITGTTLHINGGMSMI